MEFSNGLSIRQVTLDYLEGIDPLNPPTPTEITEGILTVTAKKCREVNATKAKGETKWKIPTDLSFLQVADTLARLYPICKLACAGDNADSDYDLLAIYQTDGPDKGTYVTSEDVFRTLAREFSCNMTSRDFNEMMIALRDKVPRKERCRDRDLIAVNNGIFNYKTKELLPFDPEKVFITKSHVDYNPNAKNITIHNDADNTDWDIESWMHSLSDDDEIVNLLWEILSAIIRPNVRWNKSAWLYSEKGNNGKGTLCELMRSLCGKGSYASIPIASFGQDFMLEPLTRASAIIVDENDVGIFIDKAANLKAVITNDVIQINRKFKQPIAYQFYGFMVQCLNEFPRIKDKSDSFYRRQLFIPMTKCFTGVERKYIKNEYLHNKDVLEYVLYKVLNSNFYTLSEPEACKAILQEYKEFNDPIRQYWDEFSSRFVWDLLPAGFLYDLYKSWFKKTSPSGTVQGKSTFLKDLRNLIENDSVWMYYDRNIRPRNMLDKPEMLIEEYNLTDWMNKNYTGNDRARRCQITSLPALYHRCVIRITPTNP